MATSTVVTTVEPESSYSISQRSTGFAELHNTVILKCYQCHASIPVLSSHIMTTLGNGQRLHIRCPRNQCDTLVCHSSSLPVGGSSTLPPNWWATDGGGATENSVYSNPAAADTVQVSLYTSGSFDSMEQNLSSRRESVSEYYEPPKSTVPGPSEIDFQGFEKMYDKSPHRRSWSSIGSDSTPPSIRANSPPPVSSPLSGRRTIKPVRADSIGSLTDFADVPRPAGSPRNSGDPNLFKLAVKNRSLVNLRSKSTNRAAESSSTTSLADSAVPVATAIPQASASVFHPPPRLTQLIVPHSGNARVPTPVNEEGTSPSSPIALDKVNQKLQPYINASTNTEEGGIKRRVSRRSTARQSTTRQEKITTRPPRVGIRAYIKRGLKKLVGLVMSKGIEREECGKRAKGKEREMVVSEFTYAENEGYGESQTTKTQTSAGMVVTAASPPVSPAPFADSPSASPAPSQQRLAIEQPEPQTATAPSLPLPPGPAELLLAEPAETTELARQQFDVASTQLHQNISNAIRTAMTDAWGPGSPVMVAMQVGPSSPAQIQASGTSSMASAAVQAQPSSVMEVGAQAHEEEGYGEGSSLI